MTDFKLEAFIASVNKSLKGNVVNIGARFKSLKMARFSSGCFSLDMALGGGWPFSRVAILAGEYSTGKSLIAMKAAAAIKDYDRATKKHKSLIEPEYFKPGRVLFVDAEGSLDEIWAKAIGFNTDDNVIARPEYSEQVIDIVTAAIEQNLFELIIVDSIAAMTPLKEIEDSAEDWQMGLAARLNNKAMRRWNAKLVEQSQEGIGGPLLLCINQFRLKIGTFFGDPRTLPGGKGQEFCSSIIVYTTSPEYKDKSADKISDAKPLAFGNFKGVVHKNKTFVPRQHYKFKMFLKKTGDAEVGTIDDVDDLMSTGKTLGLIKKDGSKVVFGKYEATSFADMKDKLVVNPNAQSLLWKSCLKAHCGTSWGLK